MYSMSRNVNSGIKVSVLVPIYNVENFLPQCLDSLINQTLPDIEIICINDGSTDNSKRIIESYAKKDDRIVTINKKNSGYGDSMNRGLQKATGEYIGIVESDDYIELNAFERLYQLAKEFNADIVRSNYYHYKGGKNTKFSYIEPTDTLRVIDPISRTWIFYQAPAIWSAIYKREFLEENKINFLPTPGASYQDTGFNFKALASTHKIVFTNEAFLHYRLDNESSSVNNPGKVFNVCSEYEEIENFLKEKGIYKEYGEIMQVAKFGAYYWNIYRLEPKLRRKFVSEVKNEYLSAQKDGMINESLFTYVGKWDLLNFIMEHDVDDSMRYIKRCKRRIKYKAKAKSMFKKIYLTLRPSYKKQLEISRLIDELEQENDNLSRKVEQLKVKQNNDCSKESNN